MAEELLVLVNYDRERATAIIRDLVHYSPNQPVEWYYERAIYQLNKYFI